MDNFVILEYLLSNQNLLTGMLLELLNPLQLIQPSLFDLFELIDCSNQIDILVHYPLIIILVYLEVLGKFLLKGLNGILVVVPLLLVAHLLLLGLYLGQPAALLADGPEQPQKAGLEGLIVPEVPLDHLLYLLVHLLELIPLGLNLCLQSLPLVGDALQLKIELLHIQLDLIIGLEELVDFDLHIIQLLLHLGYFLLPWPLLLLELPYLIVQNVLESHQILVLLLQTKNPLLLFLSGLALLGDLLLTIANLNSECFNQLLLAPDLSIDLLVPFLQFLLDSLDFAVVTFDLLNLVFSVLSLLNDHGFFLLKISFLRVQIFVKIFFHLRDSLINLRNLLIKLISLLIDFGSQILFV